jgi:hypothetical protein
MVNGMCWLNDSDIVTINGITFTREDVELVLGLTDYYLESILGKEWVKNTHEWIKDTYFSIKFIERDEYMQKHHTDGYCVLQKEVNSVFPDSDIWGEIYIANWNYNCFASMPIMHEYLHGVDYANRGIFDPADKHPANLFGHYKTKDTPPVEYYHHVIEIVLCDPGSDDLTDDQKAEVDGEYSSKILECISGGMGSFEVGRCGNGTGHCVFVNGIQCANIN